MWKSVQISKNTVRQSERAESRTEELKACSGCAGDYEDPDRTAWSEDDEEEANGEARPLKEEFPEQEMKSAGEEEERWDEC